MVVLNDLSSQTRVSAFTQMFGGGVMIGAVLALFQDAWVLGAVLFGIGLVAQVTWAAWAIGWSRRADRAFRAEITRGSEELVTGSVTGVEASARVVRRRIARTDPAFVRAAPYPLPPPGVVLVVELLTDDGVRRRAALVPGDIGLAARRAPVVVVQHPSLDEVAVLDHAPDPAVLAGVAADPRWQTQRLTDSQVAGGYLVAFGLAVLWLLAGVAVDAGLVALLAR
jgi:hypothetical protein